MTTPQQASRIPLWARILLPLNLAVVFGLLLTSMVLSGAYTTSFVFLLIASAISGFFYWVYQKDWRWVWLIATGIFLFITIAYSILIYLFAG